MYGQSRGAIGTYYGEHLVNIKYAIREKSSVSHHVLYYGYSKKKTWLKLVRNLRANFDIYLGDDMGLIPFYYVNAPLYQKENRSSIKDHWIVYLFNFIFLRRWPLCD